ncbi:MAG: RecQ family zinc-binding domain-containing protein, partial [Longimicrobiales bacterium]
ALRSHDIASIVARSASVAPRQAEAVLKILRRQHVLRDTGTGRLVLEGVIDWDDALSRRRHELGRLDAMDGYVRTRECRRGFILRYFGDPDAMRACGDCDNCHGGTRATAVHPGLLRRLLGRA